jgi:hypothetical protein
MDLTALPQMEASIHATTTQTYETRLEEFEIFLKPLLII